MQAKEIIKRLENLPPDTELLIAYWFARDFEMEDGDDWAAMCEWSDLCFDWSRTHEALDDGYDREIRYGDKL